MIQVSHKRAIFTKQEVQFSASGFSPFFQYTLKEDVDSSFLQVYIRLVWRLFGAGLLQVRV